MPDVSGRERIRLGVVVAIAVAAGIGAGFWWALLRPHPASDYLVSGAPLTDPGTDPRD